MVKKGAFQEALQSVNPGRVAGPWKVICDNESFLRASVSNAAHKKFKVHLIKIPAKSPDLNPVERFWSWLRRTLRAMDLQDLVKKRPVLGRMAYKQRVKRLIKSPKAKEVAANCFDGLRRVAKHIIKNKGGPSRG